jgi:hypothetical protein
MFSAYTAVWVRLRYDRVVTRESELRATTSIFLRIFSSADKGYTLICALRLAL